MRRLQEFSIGVLAERSGVPVKVIRYYTERGLLRPARVAPSGYRYYTDDELARLHQIVELRWLGASLRQIEQLLAGHVTLADVLAAGRAYVAAECDCLQRLESRLLAAEAALSNGEAAVWSHLYRVREMMHVTLEERRQWLEQWWRDQLAGKMPDSVVDEFVAHAKEMVSDSEPSPIAAIVRASIWTGTKDGRPLDLEALPGTPREAGMTLDDSWRQWKLRFSAAQQALNAVWTIEPSDPVYQTALRQWVACFGPLTRPSVRAFLADLGATVKRAQELGQADGTGVEGLVGLQDGLRYLERMLPK